MKRKKNLEISINNLYSINKFQGDSYKINNIKDTSPLVLNNIEQLVNNQILNYNKIYESFMSIGSILQNSFDTDLSNIQIKIYCVLFTYLLLHFVLIMLEVMGTK